MVILMYEYVHVSLDFAYAQFPNLNLNFYFTKPQKRLSTSWFTVKPNTPTDGVCLLCENPVNSRRQGIYLK